MPQFLLELFSEEIPARFQKQAAEDLKRLFTDKLKEQGLAFTSAEAHVTPRRLALVVEGLPLEQPARTEEKKGPKEGAPQAAIDGFLKSAGLASLDQCELRDTPKGKVWFATTHIAGSKTAQVLSVLIDSVLREMPWKKSMNWGVGTFRWVRPLHSIVALFDGQVLAGQFDLGEKAKPIPFGKTTLGHRFLSSGAFDVKDFADYKENLRKAHVILDREERKKIILAETEKLLSGKNLKLKQDEALLEEVCGLVEYPVPLLGRIDDEFMGIPPEVLVTTMRNNQKYFASLDSSGKMSPYFVITANITTGDSGAAIIAGNQRVLRARFADAKFFWELDKATKLIERLPQLQSITFHAKLGSMADKVARMEKLAVSLDIPNAPAENVRAAARLAKCDLVSGMVGEFPELQGIMGGYYARHDGYNEAVANAVTEHYSPLGPNDTCPSAPVSVAVALADKLDTLIGFFGIDEKPTGSKDPYALRRAALGVLRLIIENGLRLDLGKILPQDTGLPAFFLDRLKVMLKEKSCRHDVIEAVFASEAPRDVVGQIARLDAVQSALATEEGHMLLALYRRAANILSAEEKKDKTTYNSNFDPALLQTQEEQDVQKALGNVLERLKSSLQDERYTETMQSLLTLRQPIDRFFEKVTVNADKPELRLNRLRLLAKIRETVHLVANFSRIEDDQPAVSKAA
jgi:glycyl-tRNA synthetase beta chain